MSFEGSVGIVTSEAALPGKCSHDELRGEHRGLHFRGCFRANHAQKHPRRHRAWRGAAEVTLQRLHLGQTCISFETRSSAERSSGGKTQESSSGHMPMRLSEKTEIQQVSVGGFSEC